jgi:RNA polymerase sigma-70 factor (ECF subfamily)
LISIDNIKSGSESSFTEVFNQFHNKLYFYFLKKTRSEVIARELTQLTFVKLWRFRHTLSGDLSFDIQLFNIAASTLIDYMRRQNALRKKIIALPEATEEMLDIADDETERNFENANYLQSVAKSLSPVRKKVFLLSRIQGHSYKEIADELSISVKTVEDHMVKALKHIRSIILPSVIFLLYAGVCLH